MKIPRPASVVSVVLTLLCTVTAPLVLGAMRVNRILPQGRYEHQVRGRTADRWATMTEVQRVHARQHASYHSGHRLLDELVSASLDLAPFVDFNSPIISSLDFFAARSCEVDAVFRGTVERGTANPVEDGTFLFTDYDVRLTEFIRTRANRPPNTSQRVIVTRPGGALLLDNQRIEATINTLPFLTLGSEYLFFATYLPQSETFSASNETAAFKIDADSIKALTALTGVADHLHGAGLRKDLGLNSIRSQTCH